MRIFFRLYDPQEDGVAGGGSSDNSQDMDLGASINAALNRDDASSSDTDVSHETNCDKQSGSSSDKEGDKKSGSDDEDPEHELDFEEEQGKGKVRYKLSQLKDTAKWLHQNKQMIQGTLKIREEAGKNPAFGKLLNTIIQKSYNEKGEYQSAYVDKIMGSLEEKQAQVEDKIEDTEDDIAKMEKMLDELDPESPNAQILKGNINASKKLKASLNAALEQNKKFQERLDGLDKFKEGLTTEKSEAVKNEKLKQVAGLYDTELASLTDASKKDGYKFVDDGEKQDFDRAVRDAVVAKAGAIKTDEDFVKVVREQAKVAYERMTARREAYINDYLRKKGGNLPGTPKKEDKPNAPRTFADMGSLLADAAMTPSE